MENILALVRAAYPILYMVSAEESRAEGAILNVAVAIKRPVKVWSATEGFTNPGAEKQDSKDRQIEDPSDALSHIQAQAQGQIFILKDFHHYMAAPKIIRKLRDIARDFKQQKKTLIILTPVKKLPADLERDVTVIEFELPKREDIEKTFTQLVAQNKNIDAITEDEKERSIQAAMGLTTTEAEGAFSKAIVEQLMAKKEKKEFEVISRLVMKEKANAVKKSGILEYFETKQNISDIGGLDNLKEWLQMRSQAFSKKAREFGLKMPRGVLLVGAAGCGKSLSAKVASSILGIPLLKFDVGKIFGGLVGDSERNMRSVIQTAEAVNQCVLWIDELEKAFAGMGGSGSSDGGTSQRVFSSFLTWMQEKNSPCFIIATVNRIGTLPPELLRKGRFDEIFYVGLPSAKEREQILKIHIEKTGRQLTDKKINDCVKASEGFSGAELEEAVNSAMYSAFHRNRDLLIDDILKAITETNPLSRSKAAEVKEMTEWAAANAVNASRVEKTEDSKLSGGRQLEI